MTDELTRAIAEATEGSNREGTAKWPECCRDTYSLAIEEIAAALAPLIEARNVHREQQAFDRGYDKAMEGIEARVREARAEELESEADRMEVHARRQIALPSNGSKARQKARDKQRGHNAGAVLTAARELRKRAEGIRNG